MTETKKATTMQTLHGKLCVSLYEKFGDSVLMIFSQVYGEYGYELGSGLKKKWNPASFEEAGNAFFKMCNDAGLPSSVNFQDNVARWEGHKCPFDLENTDKKVCQALMAMDLELMQALVGTENGKISMVINKSLAAGDPICQGSYTLNK